MHLIVPNIFLQKASVHLYNIHRQLHQYIAQIVKLLQTAETGIVFEGVETAEQAEFLKAMAVNQGQGWYWERPLHWRTFQQQYCIDKPQKICYYI